MRQIVGYRRYEGLEAVSALANLYASVRLFVNVFQPLFKLAEKERDGAAVHNGAVANQLGLVGTASGRPPAPSSRSSRYNRDIGP